MQSSVRAVEAYRRTRLIDGVTSDEDKIAPVYRLEEICELLRNSPLDIVREILDYTLRRLDHKSPIVKQKTLRLIKYAAGKGGLEFKREIQRQAAIVRSLFHYRGQVDALKGDALNKAVRDTAHEAVAAIFGSDERTTTMEDVGKRIEGFGSSNYDKPREEEKKSVLSGLVGLGTQSIRQSIDMLNNYNHYTGSGSGGNRSSYSGSYRSQGLRRSLTAERDRPYDKEEAGNWNIRVAEADYVIQGSSSDENPSSKSGLGNGQGGHSDGKGHTVEDRLLDSLTTPGGVRLQPTRETLQAFTTTAQKLDAANLVNSLETKLKAHNWQVRFKALCLLEAAIRHRDTNVLDSLTAMFEEDASAVVDSLQSPQVTLRDKAKKVLNMLGGGVKDLHRGAETEPPKSSATKQEAADLPDLLDTRDYEMDSLQGVPSVPKLEPPAKVTGVVAPVQQDFFGDWPDESAASVPVKDPEVDPFAGMSFHSSESAVGNGREPDLFAGLEIDKSKRAENGTVQGLAQDGGLFDHLSLAESSSVSEDNFVNLMGDLSMSSGSSVSASNLTNELTSLSSSTHPMQQSVPAMPTSITGLNLANLYNVHQTQAVGVPAGGFPGTGARPQMLFFPPGIAQYVNGFQGGIPGSLPANVMPQQSYAPGATNLAGMNAAYVQQQFAPAFVGMQRYSGSLQTNNASGGSLNLNGSDSFDFSSDPVSRYNTALENTKKEDTKAFDFIADHVSYQLGPRKSS